MADLGLQAYVKQPFSFLVADLGFTCTACGPSRVRFESSTMFVELLFDGSRSYELSLWVGKSNVENCGIPPFSLDEILRLCHSSEAERYSLVQVTTREMLAAWIAQFAEVLRTYGVDILTGDASLYAALQEQRHLEIERSALERDLRSARAEAESAWGKKDYAVMVKALKPFHNVLTTSEIRKLEFAEKRSAQCG